MIAQAISSSRKLLPDWGAGVSSVKKSLLTVLGAFYPVLLFYLLYYFVVQAYDYLPSMRGNLFDFLTSPFSFVEAAPPYSKSITQGLYNNFLFVAVIIIIAGLYSIYLEKRFKRWLSVPLVFFSGVLSTYMASAGIWAVFGQPATGTSIIGFTMASFIAVGSIADVKRNLAVMMRGNKQGKTFVVGFLLLVLFLWSSYAILTSYLIGNGAYALHLAGGSLSWLVLLSWSTWRNRNRVNQSFA